MNFLQEMDHPVYVITTQNEGHYSGCVITWLMKASLHPHETKIAFVMSKFNHTLIDLQKTRQFILNLLSPHQIDEFYQLGTLHSGKTDKFKSFATDLRAEGIILKEGSGFAVGKITDALETPDRIIFYASLSEELRASADVLKLGMALEALTDEQKWALNLKMQHDGKRDEKQFTPN